jgi:recombination protein RecR
MSAALERLQKQFKQLPGIGYRSAERIALHLLLEKPERVASLVQAIQEAAASVRRCTRCGNLAEAELCPLCTDSNRDRNLVCVVENIPDLVAFERAGTYRGTYHVLHGRLSPIHGVGPDQLNVASLLQRVNAGEVDELILALGNEVEAEATCHYLFEHLPKPSTIRVSRIGFGLPSGGGVLYADSVTLRSALESRRTYQ